MPSHCLNRSWNQLKACWERSRGNSEVLWSTQDRSTLCCNFIVLLIHTFCLSFWHFLQIFILIHVDTCSLHIIILVLSILRWCNLTWPLIATRRLQLRGLCMLKHIATWVLFTKIVVTWSQLLLVMRGNLPISCLPHCLLVLNFFFLDLTWALHLISVIFLSWVYLCWWYVCFIALLWQVSSCFTELWDCKE